MKNMMLTLVVVLLSTSLSGFAQASDLQKSRNAGARPSMGVKAGFNYANVYDSQGESFTANPKFGVAAGVFASIPLGSLLGIQPELLLSQKGFKASGQLLGSQFDMVRTSNYIDVPIYLAVRPSQYFTFLAGPQYSFLISQEDKFTGTSTSITHEQTFESDNIRKNTLCLSGGADMLLNHLVISGRAGIDVLNNKGDGTSATPRYKNVWYQLTAGYLLY